MLPFLKREKEASSDGSASTPIKRKPDEGAEDYDALESAAEDLASALEKKDYKAIAAALRAAFELCDSEPHEEGPHTNEDEQ